MSKDDMPKGPTLEIAKGAAIPLSQLPPDASNAKLFNTPNLGDLRNESPIKESPTDGSASANAKRLLLGNQGGNDAPLSSSLPTPSPLDGVHGELLEVAGQRSNSELGHYPDTQGNHRDRHSSPDRQRGRERKSYHPTLQVVASSPAEDRTPTPDPATPLRTNPNGKVKISGPINGTPIPLGHKFGKELQPEAATSTTADRERKAKSRGFWGFGRPYGECHVG
jgi:RalA-binding protein 1